MNGHQEITLAKRLPTLASHPQTLADLSLREWDLVIRLAMRAGILARLCCQLDELGLLEAVPERPRAHLAAARTLALKHQRDIRWEVDCVCRVLKQCDVPITLLKGAAYVMAELPPARGRMFSDIDFMVPRERITEVEELLLAADWRHEIADLYDQSYYRRWTHQIPPLTHSRRNMVLDIHHTIVPPTARTPVAAEALAANTIPLPGNRHLRVLAPTDMVLHSAVHLFNEGEFKRGLRDLLDLSDLLRHFGRTPGFWEGLVERATALGLTRPLFLALRYLEARLALSLPAAARDAARAWQPSPLTLNCLDQLFWRAIQPDHHSCDDWFTGTARWLLYVRAHYLRMPITLLVPHLLRKSLVPPRAPEDGQKSREIQQRVEELLRLTPPSKAQRDQAEEMIKSTGPAL